jgi:RNA polymerase sigma-70 factor (ECF subfamily)
MPDRRDPSLLPFPDLLSRMRAGDGAAWEEFHGRYEPILRRMARRWLNPDLRRQADSADVTQSVLRTLLQSEGRVVFEDEGSLRAWLATVMRHRVLRLARRARGPGGETFGDLEPSGGPDGDGGDPALLAERAEAVHRLKGALDLLPPGDREVLLLREFEDLAFAEVAERTGRPSADAARKAHDRARRRLEEALRRGEAAGGR